MTLPTEHTRAGDEPLDFDEILRREAMTSAERAQAICDELDGPFFDALFNDVEMVVQIAHAARQAAEKRARHDEDERLAFDPATDPAEAVRLKEVVRVRRKRRTLAMKLIRQAEE